MLITITKLSPHKVAVELISDVGEIVGVPRQLSRYSETDIRWLSGLGCEELADISSVNKALLEICGDNETPGENNRRGFEVENDQLPSHLIESNAEIQYFECSIRDLEQPRSTAVQFVDVNPELAFTEALKEEGNYSEAVIEWTDLKRFCCLDIDYHELPLDKRPTEEQLSTLVQAIKPLPYCWHMSHGHGAKLYYAAKPGFTAEELASVAAFMWILVDPRATFDLIKSTRHPLYMRTRDGLPAPCKTFDSIKFTHGCGDVSTLKRLMNGELDDNDIQEFLDSRNWRIGQTLPHSECPIQPTNDAKMSVYIGEAGVYCHKCASRGFGTVRPGFVGFNQLSGRQFDSRLFRMVKGFCHLEHARIVLSHLYPNVQYRTLDTVYRVLLKCVHGYEDPRINMAMMSGRGFIRIRGQWVSTDGEHVLAHGMVSYIRSLPACLVPNEDEFNVNVPPFTAFQNTCDLSEYGYEDISLIRGCKVYGQFNKSEEVTKVIVRKEFGNRIPTYVPLHKRMASEDAWGLLRDAFPGIDENYIRLLIASKGSSEGRLSQCTYLLVAGPSGSGKSTSVQVAAGICGDRASEPIFVPNIERYRQSLADAAKSSGFVLVNEIFKHSKQAKLTPTQALDPMLSLTEDSRSHTMYVGSTPFGRMPVFVLTDISIPIEVEQDLQLSRRFTYYRLTHRNYWSGTFVSKRIQPHQFRMISADHNSAADTILSEVIDRWFREPTSLEDIAKSLDIRTLQQHSEDVDNTSDKLEAFYREVCKANPLIGSDKARYSGVGWKRIDRSTDTQLRTLYEEFCDGINSEQWAQSRVLQAEDWANRLKIDIPILCEVRAYRNQIVYIRFRSTDSSRFPSWVNGKLVKQ